MNSMATGSTTVRMAIVAALALALFCVGPCPIARGGDDDGAAAAAPPSKLTLHRVRDSGEESAYGTYEVYENRQAREGRVIRLKIVVLSATGPEPAPDPIFFLAGGPGQAATLLAGQFGDSWMRRDRDIVLVDQRGTGASNPLNCDLFGDDMDPQGLLDDALSPGVLTGCVDDLEQVADLAHYTTPIAMDDLDDVRAALGYEKINLMGGSYGTRAALVYMRRHGEHVRSAVLNAVAPLAFITPLHGARSAQHALDRLFAACAADPQCLEAFGDLRREFHAVLDRLEDEPAEVIVVHPRTGERVPVRLTRDAFGMTLQMVMYSIPTLREAPLMIHRAFAGDYEPVAQFAVSSIPAMFSSLNMGLLMCITCNEEIPRIDEEAIVRETEGTFLGDDPLRRQIDACRQWPRAEIPADYGDPVRCDVPTLIFSGTFDPATPPCWGEEAARHLPNSLHVVVPGCHYVRGPCVDEITRQFLSTASVEGVDTSCVADVKLPPFTTPEQEEVD